MGFYFSQFLWLCLLWYKSPICIYSAFECLATNLLNPILSILIILLVYSQYEWWKANALCLGTDSKWSKPHGVDQAARSMDIHVERRSTSDSLTPVIPSRGIVIRYFLCNQTIVCPISICIAQHFLFCHSIYHQKTNLQNLRKKFTVLYLYTKGLPSEK